MSIVPSEALGECRLWVLCFVVQVLSVGGILKVSGFLGNVTSTFVTMSCSWWISYGTSPALAELSAFHF